MLYMQGFFIYTHVYMSMSLFMTIDDKYTVYLSKQVVMERGRFKSIRILYKSSIDSF